MAKKWRVEITVSGISDEDYDRIVDNIVGEIEMKGLRVDIGVGTEEEEEE